jgi:hypothetical protein
MGDRIEKTVLIRSGCFGPRQEITPSVREEFRKAVEAVAGCAVVQDDDLKFSAPDEETAAKVGEALKGKYLGGVVMGLYPPAP